MSNTRKFIIWDVKNKCELKDTQHTSYFITRFGTVFSYYNDGSGGYDCDYHEESEYEVLLD